MRCPGVCSEKQWLQLDADRLGEVAADADNLGATVGVECARKGKSASAGETTETAVVAQWKRYWRAVERIGCDTARPGERLCRTAAARYESTAAIGKPHGVFLGIGIATSDGAHTPVEPLVSVWRHSRCIERFAVPGARLTLRCWRGRTLREPDSGKFPEENLATPHCGESKCEREC
ncbi:hypothetical protein HRbin20_01680 [bacterium HR20]|nr:hypothetical protein HRbin20_01680 [bacterium HR20]